MTIRANARFFDAGFVRAAVNAAMVSACVMIIATALQAQTYSVLFSFSGADGWATTGVTSDWKGNLYGTTWAGGENSYGTVYEFGVDGQHNVLYSFPEHYSPVPNGDVAVDSGGNVYGTTVYGGSKQYGVVFEVTSAGVETDLHVFLGGSDGAEPNAGLIRDSSGNLYGTTAYGGGKGNPGMIYKLDPSGVFTTLFSFKGTVGGFRPESGLLRDSKGNLYGTTFYGGTSNDVCGGSGCGTVYRLDTSNHLRVLHIFAGPPSDGMFPFNSDLIHDRMGNLYGVTQSGGTANSGVVFKIDTAGNETVVYNFTGGSDGCRPTALKFNATGVLYGTANACGAAGFGTIFKLDASYNLNVVHTFTGDSEDGGSPWGDLTGDPAGNIYGTTTVGGPNNSGTIFKVAP